MADNVSANNDSNATESFAPTAAPSGFVGSAGSDAGFNTFQNYIHDGVHLGLPDTGEAGTWLVSDVNMQILPNTMSDVASADDIVHVDPLLGSAGVENYALLIETAPPPNLIDSGYTYVRAEHSDFMLKTSDYAHVSSTDFVSMHEEKSATHALSDIIAFPVDVGSGGAFDLTQLGLAGIYNAPQDVSTGDLLTSLVTASMAENVFTSDANYVSDTRVIDTGIVDLNSLGILPFDQTASGDDSIHTQLNLAALGMSYENFASEDFSRMQEVGNSFSKFDHVASTDASLNDGNGVLYVFGDDGVLQSNQSVNYIYDDNYNSLSHVIIGTDTSYTDSGAGNVTTDFLTTVFDSSADLFTGSAEPYTITEVSTFDGVQYQHDVLDFAALQAHPEQVVFKSVNGIQNVSAENRGTYSNGNDVGFSDSGLFSNNFS